MHVMVDLETLSTEGNAAIVSIGAVGFDEVDIRDHFYRVIDINWYDTPDGKQFDLNANTIQWWMEQGEDAKFVFKDPTRYHLPDALRELTHFIESNLADHEGVWGNASTFDNVILRTAYNRLNMRTPWQFWQDRCYRTLKKLRPDVEMQREGTHHNALSDSISQAKHASAILAALNKDLP